LDEILICIAFAGPQPSGVVANKASPMMAMVTTVMVTAATMRWTLVSSFTLPLAKPC
jgi:hypothetical protein